MNAKNKNSIRTYVSLLKKGFAQPVFYSFCALFLAGILIIFSSCDTNDPEIDQIVDVVMKPDEATLEVGQNADIQLALADGSVDFSAFALTESGERVPIPDNAITTWSSTNTAVFTVSDNGTATAQGAGEAFCVIEMRPPPGGGIICCIRGDSARVLVF